MAVHTAEIRLYVGGLGERVTEEDIKNTFSNLGSVHSVELIRSKGRSFAYINFLPSSLNSLPKLFSTYNGCAWKGGKLKLEKAKEHYLDRLKREWAEEAELKSSEHVNHDFIDGSIVGSSGPENTFDLKNMEFRLFFPKLRKVRPLPLSGTGKHKYSFRRLDGPPLSVHFCDCPEHAVPVQTRTVTCANHSDIKKRGINKKEYNVTNSMKNRFLGQESSLDRRDSAFHDSKIQDDGMNEEEVNMMDSVMKKLFDRGASSKKVQENLRFSKEKSTFACEIQEFADDGTYDDDDDDADKKVNAVTVQKFNPFLSRSWERQESLPEDETLPQEERSDIAEEADDDDIQINAISVRNGRQTSFAKEITRLTERTEALNRKRKSVSGETNANDTKSLINEKKGHLKVPSKKSPWKQLVGDGSSTSFTLSQVTSENDSNHEEQPKRGNNASSDIKKSKKARRVALEPPTGIKQHEEANNCALREIQSSQHITRKSKKACKVVPEEPEPSDEVPADIEEHDMEPKEHKLSDEAPVGYEEHDVAHEEAKPNYKASADVEEHDMEPEEPKPSDIALGGIEEHEDDNCVLKESQSSQQNQKSKKARKVAPRKPKARNEASAGSEEQNMEPPTAESVKVTQGSSWLQRCTWTKLVGGGNNSSFSISQILPGDLVQKQNSHKSDDYSTVSFISTGTFSKEQRTNEMTSGISTARDMDMSEASGGIDLSDSGSKTILDPRSKPTSYSIRGVEISETCPFMRNTDSVKEWMTAKTAMSNSLKKMKNNQSNNKNH